MMTKNDKPNAQNIPKHENCRCVIFSIPKPQRTEFNDLGSKLAAQIFLADRIKGIVIPTREEWIGVNLLERDDELKRIVHGE